MLSFITDNLATIIISAALIAIVSLIVAGMIARRKKGQSAGCGCGCGGCASSSVCRKR